MANVSQKFFSQLLRLREIESNSNVLMFTFMRLLVLVNHLNNV